MLVTKHGIALIYRFRELLGHDSDHVVLHVATRGAELVDELFGQLLELRVMLRSNREVVELHPVLLLVLEERPLEAAESFRVESLVRVATAAARCAHFFANQQI